jgi:CTP:molybdopterin cytidylyltransferase MocA
MTTTGMTLAIGDSPSLTPKVIRALVNIAEAKETAEPAVAHFYDGVASLIVQNGDPDTVFDFVLEVLRRTEADQ